MMPVQDFWLIWFLPILFTSSLLGLVSVTLTETIPGLRKYFFDGTASLEELKEMSWFHFFLSWFCLIMIIVDETVYHYHLFS